MCAKFDLNLPGINTAWFLDTYKKKKIKHLSEKVYHHVETLRFFVTCMNLEKKLQVKLKQFTACNKIICNFDTIDHKKQDILWHFFQKSSNTKG